MSTFRTAASRMAAVFLLAMGAVLVLQAPASALPYSCSSGIGYNIWGAAKLYYAWANCTTGTGHYYVEAVCYDAGSYYVIDGPVKTVGQGQSRAACVDWHRPLATSVVSYN